MHLIPIPTLIRFGDRSHLDIAGAGRAMPDEAARCDPLDVVGDVRRVAHNDVSRRHWSIHPGAGLPAMPFSANILDQVVPDANLASANVLG